MCYVKDAILWFATVGERKFALWWDKKSANSDENRLNPVEFSMIFQKGIPQEHYMGGGEILQRLALF